MDALIKHCLRPIASTLPLATDEIKNLNAFKFILKMDAMNAFSSIPLDEESKKTHGVSNAVMHISLE